MSFNEWLKNNHSKQMFRIELSCYRKLEKLGLLDKTEEEFEDYIWQHIFSTNSRRKLRRIYHTYQKWKNNQL